MAANESNQSSVQKCREILDTLEQNYSGLLSQLIQRSGAQSTNQAKVTQIYTSLINLRNAVENLPDIDQDLENNGCIRRMSSSNESNPASSTNTMEKIRNDDGKNSVRIKCRTCECVVLDKNVGTFIGEYTVDVPLESQKKANPKTEKEPLSQWWSVQDVFHFENVGVTRSHEGIQYLCCSECEFRSIGSRIKSKNK
ncbi:unnamed protein product [Bursaphelenchus xylophilus]|uniref:(pine wood nematode) hypothetical protein n=1 Tax=Bursaphelenchus xylophilus TaxID=6326 RepID=A0A7I8WRT3_BURXY|nr:unnamed protein product [Bursaphelenchus xylophilus]CAG9114757.1 unnamed protein product [Bursaphelenchus xylophilus]